MNRRQALILFLVAAGSGAPVGARSLPQEGPARQAQQKQSGRRVPATPILPAAGADESATQAAENPAEKLVREYAAADQAAIQKWRAAREEGASPEELSRILSEDRPQATEWMPRFQALANEHPGTDIAFDALMWMYPREREPAARTALLHSILADFKGSPRMAELVPMMQRGVEAADAVPALTALLQSPHRPVKGLATYILALRLGESAESGDRAEKLLEQCTGEFADLEYRGRTLGEVAAASLFEQRNLSVGKVAPEIEADDTDGVAFRLSDYRGKVILLDFWGHW